MEWGNGTRCTAGRDKEEKGNHENTKNSVSQFVGAGFNRHHRGFAVYLTPCPGTILCLLQHSSTPNISLPFELKAFLSIRPSAAE